MLTPESIASPVLVRQATRVPSIPDLFLTSDSIAQYDFVLRGKIGDWLVKHRLYWCRITHSTTGVHFPVRYMDPYTRPCVFNELDFRTLYADDSGILRQQRWSGIRACGDYTQALHPSCISFVFLVRGR